MQANDATFGAGRVGIGVVRRRRLVGRHRVSVSAPTDTSAPSTPTNVTATALSFSEVAVSWSASTDDVGVTGYRVYRDATLVASPTGTSASVTGHGRRNAVRVQRRGARRGGKRLDAVHSGARDNARACAAHDLVFRRSGHDRSRPIGQPDLVVDQRQFLYRLRWLVRHPSHLGVSSRRAEPPPPPISLPARASAESRRRARWSPLRRQCRRCLFPRLRPALLPAHRPRSRGRRPAPAPVARRADGRARSRAQAPRPSAPHRRQAMP